MYEPVISVIVPIYRVEPYLRQCLDSVVGQTYRKLEIILVDDGSPDHCGSICDEYAAHDARIQVIHKKNGGISSARNAGLAAASGEWIGWVDADDWIEPDMYEYLLLHALSRQADIVVCSRYEEYRNRRVFHGWEKEKHMATDQALHALLENRTLNNLLWDRLWKREIFEGVQFPEGRTYEDIAVMHWLFLRTKLVVCLPEAKYHYRQRPGSIVNDASLANRMNHFAASKARYDALAETWPQFSHLMEAQCVASAIGIWCGYFLNPRCDRRKYRSNMQDIAGFSKRHYRSALRNMGLGLAGRFVVRLTPYATVWSFALAGAVGWAYRQKHGRNL